MDVEGTRLAIGSPELCNGGSPNAHASIEAVNHVDVESAETFAQQRGKSTGSSSRFNGIVGACDRRCILCAGMTLHYLCSISGTV